MPFVRVLPDDTEAVAATVDLLEAARQVDDPAAPRITVEIHQRWLRYGWDLRPDEVYLYHPDGAGEPVGVLSVDLSTRDNLHLVWAEVTVRPGRRRQGHGRAMVAEVVRRTREAGRSTIWLGGPEDDPAVEPFVTGLGFRYASHDARRRQVLADVDTAAVARLRAEAEAAAVDYELVRLVPPLDDGLLTRLAEVAASINDAPMGDLTWEPEVYDLSLMRDVETARAARGDRAYRVVARHRRTGELGGHTHVLTDPHRPERGVQCDTAVARAHRGHRLGLLLKAEMMAWLAEAEPALEYLETFNQADNSYMIDVNEALGYRLDRIFRMYELTVPVDAPAPEAATAFAGV